MARRRLSIMAAAGLRLLPLEMIRLKGDSNGDGTATVAADSDWEGIEDGSQTISNPDYFFTWSNIYYDTY